MDENITRYLKEINKVPDLSKEKELELVKLVLEGDDEAAEKLADAHLKHVAILALEYWEKYEKKIDIRYLIEWGNTGLFRAVRKYTPRESRFWKYATWWVCNGIERRSEEFLKLIH